MIDRQILFDLERKTDKKWKFRGKIGENVGFLGGKVMIRTDKQDLLKILKV